MTPEELAIARRMAPEYVECYRRADGRRVFVQRGYGVQAAADEARLEDLARAQGRAVDDAEGQDDPGSPLSPVRPATAPGRAATAGPSAAQWRAVADALERFTGRGRWSAMGRVSADLPAFSIRWINPNHPDPGFPIDRAGALTAFFAGGGVVMALRTDSTPDELLRFVCHELQHVIDQPLIRTGMMSERVYEARATDTARRLVGWGPLS